MCARCEGGDVSGLTEYLEAPVWSPFFVDGAMQLLQAPCYCRPRFFAQRTVPRPPNRGPGHRFTYSQVVITQRRLLTNQPSSPAARQPSSSASSISPGLHPERSGQPVHRMDLTSQTSSQFTTVCLVQKAAQTSLAMRRRLSNFNGARASMIGLPAEHHYFQLSLTVTDYRRHRRTLFPVM